MPATERVAVIRSVRLGGAGFQTVLEDLSIERAAADLQDLGGVLLVPADGFEDADDMGSFGFGERRQSLLVRRGQSTVRVQEFDVGGADDTAGRRQRGA